MQLTEELLVEIWQNYLVGLDGLVTNRGSPIRILFPGREQRGGPDFTDSVVEMNGVEMHGDVEIDCYASNWRTHNHYQNRRYNNVILHVVGRIDTQYSSNIETFSLQSYLDNLLLPGDNWQSPGGGYQPPCVDIGKTLEKEVATKLLGKLGEEWFFSKVKLFRQILNHDLPDQVLYQYVMRALGYSKNKTQMQQLASRVPLSLLRDTLSSSNIKLEAILFGMAGMLPSQRHLPITDHRTIILENLWREHGWTESMRDDDWDLFEIRPLNHPVRRLAAVPYWLNHFQKAGLVSSLITQSEEAMTRGIRYLYSFILVEDTEYWSWHYDFGRVLKHRTPKLIGEERAKIITVNAFLPFLYAYAELNSYHHLKKLASSLYAHFPPLSNNMIYLYMLRKTGLNNIHLKINSACQQQGLIYLFQLYCKHHKCHLCELNANNKLT